MKAILAIIILGFIIYGNSLSGEFIWDDEFLVRDNLYIRDISHISKFFTRNNGEGAGVEYHFYRPLQMITYTADYSLYGLNVKGYHFTNILLHILAALSLYWLINALFGNRVLSFLVGIFFVAHPIHTESVSYMSGRSDPLMLTFMLLSFIFYLKNLDSGKLIYYILTSLSFIFALLAREGSLLLVPLLLLYHYAFRKKLNVKGFYSLLSIALIYILIRLTVLKHITLYVDEPSSALQRMPGFFVSITHYIRLLLFPFNLHMDYGKKLFSILNPAAILGLIILFLLLVYALQQKNNNKLVFFSILWFFIALLPYSNVYPLNAYMAEHWLYVPSIGFFLILANAILSLRGPRSGPKQSQTKEIASSVALLPPRNDGVFICVTLVLIAFYSFLTIRQNGYWKEPMAFYKRTLELAPDSARVYYNLGNKYREEGDLGKAMPLFKKSIESDPNYVKPYYILGVIYEELGRQKDAIEMYEKVVAIKPAYAAVYNNLGTLYGYSGESDNAIAAFEKAISLDPDNPKVYYNLSVAYYRMGQYELSVEYCDKAEALGLTDSPLIEMLKPYRK